MLPEGIFVYHWDRGAGTDNWGDAANWYNSTGFFNNQVPVPPADLVFGEKPSGTAAQTVVLNTANTAVRSLWFEAGRDYTLQGTGSFILGGGLADNRRLVTVLEGGLPENRYTINLPISLTQESPAKTFEIANYSTDSLLSFLGNVNLKGNSLRITGTGATYFGGYFSLISGSTLSTVASSATQPTILILNPGNIKLNVGNNTLVVGDTNVAAVYAGLTVQSGGTYVLRTMGGLPASPNPGDAATFSGHGVIRQSGTSPIGALYSDGWALITTQNGSTRTHTTLAADTSFGSRHGRSDGLATYAVITGIGSAGLTTVGSGRVTLGNSGHNSVYGQRSRWSGATNLNGGVLTVTDHSDPHKGSPGALPITTNLRFNGGILELASLFGGGSFSGSLGTSAGQFQWLGDGGFSSAITNLVYPNTGVKLNNGAALTWGSGYFVPTGKKLLLSSRYALARVDFLNAINLGSQLREVRVERGLRLTDSQGNFYENATARISGTLSGTGGGILKTGPGLLWLSNAANSYTGATLIREGALRGTIPNLSNIQLEGGVLGLESNFIRGVGTTGNQIRWLSSGGFAAYGQNYTVKLSNLDTAIAWGATNFVQAGQELRFGHYTADAAVIWDRALNFGDAMRTIRVERGQAIGSTPDLVDVSFNRALNNSTKSGGLRLVGDGRADLAADSNNLDSDLLEISGAELRLATSNVRLGPVGNVALSEGGRFTIGNFGFGSYDSGQVSDTTKVTLNTGTLRYEGRTTENLPNTFWNFPSVETIGDVAVESGANEIRLQHNMPATGNTSYTQLDIGELQRATTSRATLNFTSNALNAYGVAGKVRLSAATTIAGHMLGGISPWATINGTDWATTDAGNANYIASFAAYSTGNTHSGNYSTNASVAFGNVTLNSLRISDWYAGWPSYATHSAQATLNGAVTLSSGGLLANGTASDPAKLNSILGTGTLTTSANRPLYTHVYGRGLIFNDSVRFIGGMDWVKTGPSVLRYNSTGASQIGSLYVHQGTVELNNGAFNTGANGQVFIGDGGGRDTLVINGGTNRLANRPKVTLRGTPYGRGAEFGADEDQATLALTNGATQSLRELHIIDRGTIDFTNGNPSAPNRLFLDLLTFNNSGAQLFVRGWHEFEDFLLIKKTAYAVGQWSHLLSQIFFDGYSLDYNLLVKNYNTDYYQITPWGAWDASAMPEPSTYGALLGAVGLALVAWRKRKKTHQPLPAEGRGE